MNRHHTGFSLDPDLSKSGLIRRVKVSEHRPPSLWFVRISSGESHLDAAELLTHRLGVECRYAIAGANIIVTNVVVDIVDIALHTRRAESRHARGDATMHHRREVVRYRQILMDDRKLKLDARHTIGVVHYIRALYR